MDNNCFIVEDRNHRLTALVPRIIDGDPIAWLSELCRSRDDIKSSIAVLGFVWKASAIKELVDSIQ